MPPRSLIFAIWLSCLSAGHHILFAANVDAPVLFDFGTAASPVATSTVRVTDRDVYRARAGFGWTSNRMSSFDRDRPLAELRHGGNPLRPDLLYKSHATPLNRDGVASQQEMRFRIDVEPGQRLEKGDPMGRSGTTGLAGGDHLHFAVLVGGTYIDPLEWWDGRWIASHVEVRFPKSDR